MHMKRDYLIMQTAIELAPIDFEKTHKSKQMRAIGLDLIHNV